MIKFIFENFSHVAPILGIGFFGLVVIAERIKALYFDYAFPFSEPFFARIQYLVLSERIRDAVGYCESVGKKPPVQVVKEGLLRAHQPEPIIEHGLQLIVSDMTQRITARTGYLSTVANVATLFGLFGTIVGLVQSFEAVGNANAQERATLLAQGISTAMNATMLGLAVAIPCMIVFSLLIARTNKLTSDVERAAVRTLDILKQRYYGTGAVPDEEKAEPPAMPRARAR